MPKNPKRGHLGSLNVFYKPKTYPKQMQGVPFDKFRKFSKKSRIVPEKNTNGDPLVSLVLYCNLWFSARIEPTLSGFRKLVEIEQMNKL